MPLTRVELPRAANNLTQATNLSDSVSPLDFIPYTRLYSHHLAPSEGALEGTQCGDGRKVASEMRRQGLRDRSGDTRPVGAVAVDAEYAIRAAAAQAVWSRHASRGSCDIATEKLAAS